LHKNGRRCGRQIYVLVVIDGIGHANHSTIKVIIFQVSYKKTAEPVRNGGDVDD
jgi:hypothetical protein